ncbi:MAG: ankyrin repeat domain-containing protein [Desulfobacterales bacterium]|nr:ankyrin repeat domain-containing protein [Desulfobacterales bacterium]
MGYQTFVKFINNDDISGIQKLVRDGINVNTESHNGATPLMAAARLGKHQIAEYLLKNGANVEGCNRKNRNRVSYYYKTPLLIAADSGNNKLIKILLRYNANIEATTACGETPLSVAAGKGFWKTVVLLLREGALVNIFPFNESLIAHVGEWTENHKKVIELLKYAGAE